MYTTLTIIEFSQKGNQGYIIPTKIHRNIYTVILLIDPTTKMINNDGKVFTHPKEFKIAKVYVCFNIESVIQQRNFMYNNDRDKRILPLLRKNNMWMKRNKFSTHKESSIGFIKFINSVVTLQTAVISRVELALCSAKLTPEQTK